MALFLAAESSAEGDGVNVLPILLVVVALGVALFLWRRRR